SLTRPGPARLRGPPHRPPVKNPCPRGRRRRDTGQMSVTIREVPLQEAGAAPAPLMVDLAGVLRRELVAVFGHDDLADSPEVLTRALAEQRYRRKLALVALDGDRPVGGGWFRMPLQDNTHVVEGQIAVDPEAD